MRDGARASAAIEVLADIEARKRPASEALKDWGLAHRFAGSGDRAAIGNLPVVAWQIRRREEPREVVNLALRTDYRRGLKRWPLCFIVSFQRETKRPRGGVCEMQ